MLPILEKHHEENSGVWANKTLNISLSVGILISNKINNFISFSFEGLMIVVITSAIIISSFYFLIYRSMEIKNKQRELRIKFLQIHTLQSQMNPHFIFNVLGTIQSLILKEKTELANKYLISFSNLIRRFLDSTVASNNTVDSYDVEVTLKDEIELLNLYLDFERLQYDDKFDIEFNVDDSINMELFSLPPMIIQPFVENAIKHGLKPLEYRGKLSLRFYVKDEALICEIEDNGVGRKKSEEYQNATIKVHQSRGIDLVKQRVDILNTLDYDIRIFTEDLTPQGTRVNIFFNLK
jgi:LytS/YehU family sensor histidine kinase